MSGIRRSYAVHRRLARSNTWWSLLRQLPPITEGTFADLVVDTGTMRVWRSRCGLADGEPFRHTVHVEATDADGCRYEVGYFDGDEPAPRPAGQLGEALAHTRLAVALHLLAQQQR